MATHQIYGYLNGAYYEMDSTNHIVIPDTNDITQSFVKSSYLPDTHEEEIDMYCYHSDLTTMVNKERVNNMKDFLEGNIIKNIDKLNNDFVLGISYEIYNKDGKCIKTGSNSIASSYVMAFITSDVDEEDRLKYRKAYVIDGKISVEIPSVSHYGIKNCCMQGPYTVKFTNMTLKSTKGCHSCYIEEGSQMNYNPILEGGNSACYNHHCDCDCACGLTSQHENFNSNFITNRIGTVMIDQLVVPAILEAPVDYEMITIASFDLTGSSYTIKTSENAKGIIVNMEICLDNFNEVYDKEVIDEIIEENRSKDFDPDECPCPNCPCKVDDDDENQSDDDPDPSDNPTDTDDDSTNGDDVVTDP